jgi:AcrR family transcriptional regulator
MTPARSAARPKKDRHQAGSDRDDAETRLLDAAEHLLIEEGYAAITTRRLAAQASINHGLVHYYFGSMDALLGEVLERFTSRLIARQRAMYATPVPFVARWRTAMRFLEEDRPYQKIWYELQAMAWNRPELRPRLKKVQSEWREAMRDAVAESLARYQLDETGLSIDAWITLIVTMNEGIILERLGGLDRGHADLLASIDRWLAGLDTRTTPRRTARSNRKA